MLATVLRLFLLFELTVYSALAWYFLDATVLSAALYAVAGILLPAPFLLKFTGAYNFTFAN